MIKLPVKYDNLSFHDRKIIKKEYIKVQKGLCYFCKGDLNKKPIGVSTGLEINPLLFPIGFFKHPVHLHHDHNTGMTLGAVHCECNARLWQYYGE